MSFTWTTRHGVAGRYATGSSLLNSLVSLSILNPECFRSFSMFILDCSIAGKRSLACNENKKNSFPDSFDLIGTYYYNNPHEKISGEFDVVTYGPEGYIFYEVKYRKTKVTLKTIRKEIEQVKKAGLECYKYGFISKSGFESGIARKDLQNLILIDLKDIYRA